MNTVNHNERLGAEDGGDAFEAMVAALDVAPTGAALQPRDYGFLLVSGVVLPALLLGWGWA